jgi:hypothetical protein
MEVNFFWLIIFYAVLNHNKLQVISYPTSYRTLKTHVRKYSNSTKQKKMDNLWMTY